jgi:uncharacterized protein YcfL
MRYLIIIPVVLLISLLLSACGSSQASPITPAPESLTFLFFYTEG